MKPVTRPADTGPVATIRRILAEQHQRIGAPVPPKPEPRKETKE